MHEFDKANLTHPIFREEYGGVSAFIPREIFLSIQGAATKPVNMGTSRTKTELKSRIIEMIKSNPTISKVDLSVQLGLHESSVQRRLDALVKDGRLRHIGPTNGGSWEVIE